MAGSEFGLVCLIVLSRSRRPAECDRNQLGLVCAALLIEMVWESVIAFGLVYFVMLG